MSFEHSPRYRPFPPRPSTSVVERALRILSAFAEGRERQTLSELSRRTGLPLSTTQRIAKELQTWGALEMDDDKRYRVGLRLWEIASLAPRSMGLQSVAKPYLSDLYEITRYSIHLAIREGHEAVFIDRIQSPQQETVRPRIGGRYPLYATAVGLVLLAHSPSDVQEEVLARDIRLFTTHSFKNAAEVRRALADVRLKGFAVSDRQVNPLYAGVAAPITGPDGEVTAALSLITKHDDADEKNLIHLLKFTSTRISHAARGVRMIMTDAYLPGEWE